MYLVLKRIFDIIFSFILLIILIPLYIIISLILFIKNKKILFIQARTGKNNSVFNMYKFISINNSKSDKFDYFIRKTGIDELPQLFNILKGEMSFIGPRPWIVDYSKYFNNEQIKRLDILPGLTGYSQIHNCKDIFEKINYDIYYVNNISLLLDIKIFFITIYLIIFGKKKEFTNNDIKTEINMLKEQ